MKKYIISGYLATDPEQIFELDDTTMTSKLKVIYYSFPGDDIGSIFIVHVKGEYAAFCQQFFKKNDIVFLEAYWGKSVNEDGEYSRLVSYYVKCMKFKDCVMETPLGLRNYFIEIT